jgi:aminoglycoside phosphotransferase family enzyme/predicted kinase
MRILSAIDAAEVIISMQRKRVHVEHEHPYAAVDPAHAPGKRRLPRDPGVFVEGTSLRRSACTTSRGSRRIAWSAGAAGRPGEGETGLSTVVVVSPFTEGRWSLYTTDLAAHGEVMTEMLASQPAGVRETHISVVVLVADRAYKLKKAVMTGFLDWSDRRSRLDACCREVELNRRLAPDVYLGVADVVGSDGVVCDHLVVMRRMPDERRLAFLVTAGQPLNDEVRRVARLVADFHGRAERSAAIDRAGSVESVRALWVDNFYEMAPFRGDPLDGARLTQAQELALGYLAGRRPLFDRRIADGCIVDGHGDLLAEDIWCLDDGPRILDCLEFADRFRWGDVLADVGFLAMDLERLGAPELARHFLNAYREFTCETHPVTLEHHYTAYRALVRSKVACIRAGQSDAAAGPLARAYLEQCIRHLERGAVRLVLIGGLPGTGKSTVADGLAERLGWVVLRSDEIRKETVGLSHDQAAGSPFGQGIYDARTTDVTYRELLDRARVALGFGECVIADASWTDPRQRAQAEAVARATHSDLVELCCELPAGVAAERLRARTRDASDATPAIAAQMAARLAPWPSKRLLDTAAAPDEVLRDALELIGSASHGPIQRSERCSSR